MTAYEKTSEVISAIKKYDNMRDIVASTPDEIKAHYDRLTAPHTPVLDGMPKTHNPNSGEVRLVNGLDLINTIQERFRNAQLFVEWFEPMWNALSTDERRLLETYKHTDVYAGSIAELTSEFSYSSRQLRRVRQKALRRLEILLYGY